MIDVTKDEMLSLSEVCNRLKVTKKPALSTVRRWTQGIRGTRLETIRVGGAVMTSLQALQDFCDRLGQVDAGVRVPTPSASEGRTRAGRRKAIDSADRELDRLGL